MTKNELYWLAGWLEGEGTFLYAAKKMALCIQAFSVDKDTVQCAVKIANARMYLINQKKRYPTYQDGWRFNLERRPAEALMRKLLPLMGERRRRQIKIALNGWDKRENRPVKKYCACGCGETLVAGPRKIYTNRTHAVRAHRHGLSRSVKALEKRLAIVKEIASRAAKTRAAAIGSR
jgi:hypothetical protein